MKNTKVKIWFESVESKQKQFCTIVVENKQSKEDIFSKLEWGNEYNYVISALVTDNRALIDWGIVSTTETDDESNLIPEYIVIPKKEKTQTVKTPVKSEERIVADFLLKHLNLDIPDISKLYDVFEDKLLAIELYKANTKHFCESYGLTVEMWDWWVENKANNTYFKPNPYSIKKQYMEAHAKTEEEKQKAQEIKTPKMFKYGNDLSGQLIKVVDYNTMELLGTVDYKLFERYIRHLHTKNIKTFDANEYERVRCELHDDIFDALGGDRIKDRDRLGGAIDHIVHYTHKCLCGSSINIIDHCTKCNILFKVEYAIENLKHLIVK